MEKSNFLKPATLLPIAAAVLLMGVSCYYQGMWSERWGTSPEMLIYPQQLHEVPLTVGEWEGIDIGESDDRTKEISGSRGEFNRVYKNASGEEVNVMLMCAHFRDIFSHTPEICYPAAGFEILNPPEQVVIDDSEFFTTTFRKSDNVNGTRDERGYWSWSADGKWYAPEDERGRFAGERALYKLYVFTTVPTREGARSDKDISSDFIRAFMPAVQTALRPGFERVERIRKGEEVADAELTPAAPAKSEPAAAPAAESEEAKPAA